MRGDILNTTINLHALSPNASCAINPAQISEIIEAKFGGCGIVFADRSVPVYFWESKEQVLRIMMASQSK
jgi:hypothetical protein